jgi:bifunctional DNase/RNase
MRRWHGLDACSTVEFDVPALGYHGRQAMQQMDIYGVSFDLVGKQPIVLLKTQEGNKFLPIWIGHPEAAAILMRIQGATTPRPMTHDLLTDVLGKLDAEVIAVTVTELRDNTFYASITVQQDGSEIEIDSRPSDAIALAVRAEAPIFVADDVIEESAIEFEGEEGPPEDVSRMSPEQQAALKDQFREFLENVTPDQFAATDPDE